jgi:hypothetical protein
MPRVSCPHCSATIQAPDEAVGKHARCPRCKHPFQVPLALDLGPDPKPEPEPEPAPAEIPDKKPRFDQEPPPRRAGGRRDHTVPILRTVVWAICILVVMSVWSTYQSRVARAETVMQQAVAGTDGCLYLIGTYALARAADAILQAWGPSAPK